MEHNYAGAGPSDKKKRNSNYCSAPQCSQYADTGISMHLFPKDVKVKRQWEVALKMGKPASSAMRICSRHFLPSDYFPATANVQRHKLRPNSVPSQNLPKRKNDIPESSPKKRQKLARQERATQRKSRHVYVFPFFYIVI
ncbi:THAP domain-containing protein 6-like [Thrips palmi]|uniref:THAP domain-containing protein 6-like n=1 Tax=Thrips palmi TaxID=161013 RepID=A0A6P9ADF0_THRPL|nr:THAP domain-containing protein 6-like [Thrips palmi]